MSRESPSLNQRSCVESPVDMGSGLQRCDFRGAETALNVLPAKAVRFERSLDVREAKSFREGL